MSDVSFCRYDHPHILAGQGTMGLEIVEQVPDLDAVIIPVGGGGLIAGTALAIKSLCPRAKVIVSTACDVTPSLLSPFCFVAFLVSLLMR